MNKNSMGGKTTKVICQGSVHVWPPTFKTPYILTSFNRTSSGVKKFREERSC